MALSSGMENAKSAKTTQKAQRNILIVLRFLCFFFCAFCVPLLHLVMTWRRISSASFAAHLRNPIAAPVNGNRFIQRLRVAAI
jgi:hypothetical protein